MKRLPVRPALAVTGALAAFALVAQRAPAEPALDGAALFTRKCAMCHRGRGMGTVLLARRMDPAIADLEKRSDLDAEAIKALVRGGIGNMPRIPRGEVSDAQLNAIAAWLAGSKAK